MQTIEPFEASLRENTPLTSISDPSALVEYLNNINLKGDMVLDELKRVSSEKDTFKQKLDAAEKDAKEAWDEVANLRTPESNNPSKGQGEDKGPSCEAVSNGTTDADPLGVSAQSPTTPAKSRKGSLASLSIFSPKPKPAGSPTVEEKSEDLFSFGNEIPRLEAEIKEKKEEIDELQGQINSLKGDLAVTRESTQSMAESLEEATRELNMLRERKDKSGSELKEQQSASLKEINSIKADLHNAEGELRNLKASTDLQNNISVDDLKNELEASKQEIDDLRARTVPEDDQLQAEKLQAKVEDLEAEITTLHADAKSNGKRVDTLNGIVSNLRGQLKASDEAKLEDASAKKRNVELNGSATDQANDTPQVAEPTAESNATSKKKNKKKRKGGKSTTDSCTEATSTAKPESMAKSVDATQATTTTNDTLTKLQSELEQLHSIMTEKDTALEKLQLKLKDQDDLKEEIETLRDDLINVGQEHVEAKDRAKSLLAEKKELEATVVGLEKEIADLKGSHASTTAGSEEKHHELVEQVEDLKSKTASLQTDLSAAEKLANIRFKDITELKSIIQKAQPELATLRAESAELKNIREVLAERGDELKRLEGRQEEVQSELSKLKRTVSERDKEVKTLNQKIAQESNGRLKAEESRNKSSQEVHDLTVEKQHATESIDRLSRELAKAREELRASKARLQELEQQVCKLRNENEGLKEEAELKTAQYASAQSLMTSMRDQTAEMATQMKETRERCESLDEEVAEAHRLLGERTREGETMRRLLADVEGRADARTREMKERMDTAIEERDRAEDEASTVGRRKAREMEEMRNKVREAEKNLKRAEDDKEDLESAQRDWKRLREDLEYRTEQSAREAEDVRRAMSELRDALDESEKQARELERQKAESRRLLEETQQRLEKLQKSNKVCIINDGCPFVPIYITDTGYSSVHGG